MNDRPNPAAPPPKLLDNLAEPAPGAPPTESPYPTTHDDAEIAAKLGVTEHELPAELERLQAVRRETTVSAQHPRNHVSHKLNPETGLRPASRPTSPPYSPNEQELRLALSSPLLDAIADLVEERLLARQDTPEVAPEWLSVETAARHLDVSPERVRKLVARRAIAYYQDGPGCRVFLRRRELDDYMGRSRIAAAPERDA